MNNEIVDLILMVKTYPQPSKRYQNLVCSAGITDDGRWLRLYPIRFEQFIGDYGIEKHDVLRLKIEKNRSDDRKESYKVLDILKTISKGKDMTPYKVHDWVQKVGIDPSMDELKRRYKDDFTSIGIIKPKIVEDLVSEKPISEEDVQIAKDIQMTLDGEKLFKVDKIMNTFRYVFSCDGACNHHMMCEDWELLGAYRRYLKEYPDEKTTWSKLHNRFYTWLIEERDLHFIVGTHSRFPTWMIIGLYYPPKDMFRPKDLKLDDF